MDKLPAAVIIVDLKSDRNALKEVQARNIPVIALADTNIDPKDADYPIPANDDAIKSIEVILNAFSEEIAQYAKPAEVATDAKKIEKEPAKKEEKTPEAK